jgi:hypothetical protein
MGLFSWSMSTALIRVEPNSIPKMAFPASIVCLAVIIFCSVRIYLIAKVTYFLQTAKHFMLKIERLLVFFFCVWS